MTVIKAQRWLLLAGLGLVLAGFMAGCGGKYDDVIAVNEQFVAAMEDFSSAMETVKDSGEAAAALNEMAEAVEELAPRMQELSKKYPELRNSEEVPEELEAVRAESEAAGQRFSQSMMKLMGYMEDPEVQKAQMRLSQAMEQMGAK